MKKKIFVIFACVMLIACLCVACTEKTKQDAIVTDTNGATVSSNGGMAVSYGNYVYFVNGYAGETALNTFGDVIRGAICRVTLKDGVPDYKSVVTIVPKNIYGEDTVNGGIYIVDGYIYYNTTSVDKDGDRNYKSAQGVLTRTSLDGSKTEIIKELDDNDISLYAGDNSNYLVYAYDNYLYSVNPKTLEINSLTQSTAKDSTDDQTSIAHKFVGDYAIFTMYNYADSANYSKDYFVNVYDLKTNTLKTVMSSDIFNGNNERKVLFATTITDATVDANGNLTLFYSKSDNTQNGTYIGYYSYTFDSNLTYNAANEIRYSNEITSTTYTEFYRLNNGYVLAFSKTKLDVYNNGQKIVKTDFDVIEESKYVVFDFENEITMIDVYETDTEVYAYYIYSSKFYYVKLYNKTTADGVITYTAVKENTVAFFSGTYNTKYVSYDIIDGVIYYLNDKMSDNAYYYVIPELSTVTASTDTATGKILGIISKDDMATLITEEPAATDESKK